MNRNILPVILLAAAAILGGLCVRHQRSQVRYVGIPCPACGAEETLDFGPDEHGGRRAHCSDCKQEFTVSEVTLCDDAVCR